MSTVNDQGGNLSSAFTVGVSKTENNGETFTYEEALALARAERKRDEEQLLRMAEACSSATSLLLHIYNR